ncbi:MAG TPA: spondin domain-containing protein [Balneolaceae bacterium]|nr:spondin domain-containing protein [Balneolaceae bacterium]
MDRIYKQFPIPILLVVFALAIAACKDGNHASLQNAKFEVTVRNAGQAYPILKSDAFTIPVSASDPGPLKPGDAYEFEFTAPVGAHLSLATMFGQSNDWFFATDEDGIALYNNDGTKVTGDVTSQIDLYDAGTEEDQEPGVGDNQAPRQSGPNTGPADDNPNVRLVDDSNLPSNDQMIKITLMSTGKYGFKVRIENESDSNTLQTSEGGKPVLISPGVWLVHSANQKGLIYTLGQADYGDGLEALAEDGNPMNLKASLGQKTGLTVPLSPGAFAIYNGSNPIFMSGKSAPDNGIEGVAEDGNPEMLGTALQSEQTVSDSGVFTMPDGSTEAMPAFPGHQFTFTFMAHEGEKLTFATMFAQSNDAFYSPKESGIDLFANGTPTTGNVTDQIVLWDAGTEANEEPGVGSNQAPRQSAMNTGPDDPNPNVRQINDGYDYGDVASHIKVTIRTVNK